MKSYLKEKLAGAAVMLIFFGISLTTLAAGDTYHFGVSDQRSNVTFESTTDFEVVLGSTNKLRGKARINHERGTGTLAFKIPVSSLRTGIDLRDQHMRSPMWMNAEKYPDISFESERLVKVKKNRWQVHG